MRKPTLLLCSLFFLLAGCTRPADDRVIRTREERPFPNPTLGTDNPESQWYKTQILASPSAPSAPMQGAGTSGAASPAVNRPARAPREVTPAGAAAPGAKAASSGT